ncbi:MAG: tRNA lysidine(34) synthetase TilS [Bacteroidales bacterium]|nr:tRNA lysidine(34) synthetase TilS [Bacteroidales bacterium]
MASHTPGMNEDHKLLHRFGAFVASYQLFEEHDRILLAVSGGIDSMVMARLFSLSGKSFGLAHCNFSLRGNDSDLDEQLVKRSAMMLGVPFYSATFDTREFAQQNKISIQEAARELRYEFLQETAIEYGYDRIATAHHLDDSIETMLINLIRGTGVRGLAGIPLKNENIIRPLLFATRQEIEAFALEHQIDFRTDASNLQDKYLRNRIRHHIIPILKELNPAMNQSMHAFIGRMQQAAELLELEVEKQKTECISPEREGFAIEIAKLQALPQPELMLYEFLRDCHFSGTVCRELLESLEAQSGKRFYSETHMAIKDRQKIFVKPLRGSEEPMVYSVYESTKQTEVSGAVFFFETLPAEKDMPFPASEETAMLNYDLLEFPLELRKARAGDSMVPLGMKGRKKLSDLLTDQKIPRHLKEEVWVVVSGGEIAWVAGIRISEMFRITHETTKVFRAKIGRL